MASPIEAAATPADVPGAEPQGVLTVATGEPSTLDPMRIQDPAAVLIARQLYEGLTRWDPVAERVVPAAAQSWRVSKGGRVFRFKLRPGMTFHDGRRVTAADFAFAFDRIAQKAHAADLAYTLQEVEGFDEVNRVGSSKHLSGITTRNSRILVIRLSVPDQDFPIVLTHPGLVPLEKRVVAHTNKFLIHPIGNGPFEMDGSWTAGSPVELKAFPGYFDDVGLAGIRFVPYRDAASSWIRFLRRDLDVAEVPVGQTGEARRSVGARGFQPLLAGYYYGFNLQSPNLRDVHLRKAINRAIDRAAIAQSIFKGTMQEPRGIVPAGMPGFSADACARLCSYSSNKARALVKKVPRRDRSVVIEFTQGKPHDEVARTIRRDLARVGIEARLRPYPFAKYLRLLSSGAQSVYRLGWIAEYPSPQVFLDSLFSSRSPDNHSGFASPRVDALLAKAARSPSLAKRMRLYRKAEKTILRRAPIAPVGTFVTHWAAQRDVHNIHFDVMGGFDAASVTLGG